MVPLGCRSGGCCADVLPYSLLQLLRSVVALPRPRPHRRRAPTRTAPTSPTRRTRRRSCFRATPTFWTPMVMVLPARTFRTALSRRRRLRRRRRRRRRLLLLLLLLLLHRRRRRFQRVTQRPSQRFASLACRGGSSSAPSTASAWRTPPLMQSP